MGNYDIELGIILPVMLHCASTESTPAFRASILAVASLSAA